MICCDRRNNVFCISNFIISPAEKMEVPKEPGLEPKGGKFTPYYGAITNIWDETSSIIVKDDKENELVVEVFPIRMKEDEIYKVLQEDENRWIIKYETKLGEPSKAQIQQAIETGQLLQISQTLRVTDNYGIHYTLIYDKDKKTYVNNNKNIGLESKIEPLPDVMINYIQKDKTGTPTHFPIPREPSTLSFKSNSHRRMREQSWRHFNR